MRRRPFLAATVAALLVGCATSGMRCSEMTSSMAPLKPDEGRIFFYRAASPFGAAVQPEIKLNGVAVGTSKPGGFFYVDRPAGTYEAHASTEVDRMVSFALAPGETKYIRTSPSFGVLIGRINFKLMNPSEAEAEMASLHYTGT
jgi:hypothetical protein